MEGREVFKRAVRAVTGSVENALAQAGISAEDIDVVLPHQANIRIIEGRDPTSRHPHGEDLQRA